MEYDPSCQIANLWSWSTNEEGEILNGFILGSHLESDRWPQNKMKNAPAFLSGTVAFLDKNNNIRSHYCDSKWLGRWDIGKYIFVCWWRPSWKPYIKERKHCCSSKWYSWTPWPWKCILFCHHNCNCDYKWFRRYDIDKIYVFFIWRSSWKPKMAAI